MDISKMQSNLSGMEYQSDCEFFENVITECRKLIQLELYPAKRRKIENVYFKALEALSKSNHNLNCKLHDKEINATKHMSIVVKQKKDEELVDEFDIHDPKDRRTYQNRKELHKGVFRPSNSLPGRKLESLRKPLGRSMPIGKKPRIYDTRFDQIVTNSSGFNKPRDIDKINDNKEAKAPVITSKNNYMLNETLTNQDNQDNNDKIILNNSLRHLQQLQKKWKNLDQMRINVRKDLLELSASMHERNSTNQLYFKTLDELNSCNNQMKACMVYLMEKYGVKFTDEKNGNHPNGLRETNLLNDLPMFEPSKRKQRQTRVKFSNDFDKLDLPNVTDKLCRRGMEVKRKHKVLDQQTAVPFEIKSYEYKNIKYTRDGKDDGKDDNKEKIIVSDSFSPKINIPTGTANVLTKEEKSFEDDTDSFERNEEILGSIDDDLKSGLLQLGTDEKPLNTCQSFDIHCERPTILSDPEDQSIIVSEQLDSYINPGLTKEITNDLSLHSQEGHPSKGRSKQDLPGSMSSRLPIVDEEICVPLISASVIERNQLPRANVFQATKTLSTKSNDIHIDTKKDRKTFSYKYYPTFQNGDMCEGNETNMITQTKNQACAEQTILTTMNTNREEDATVGTMLSKCVMGTPLGRTVSTWSCSSKVPISATKRSKSSQTYLNQTYDNQSFSTSTPTYPIKRKKTLTKDKTLCSKPKLTLNDKSIQEAPIEDYSYRKPIEKSTIKQAEHSESIQREVIEEAIHNEPIYESIIDNTLQNEPIYEFIVDKSLQNEPIQSLTITQAKYNEPMQAKAIIKTTYNEAIPTKTIKSTLYNEPTLPSTIPIMYDKSIQSDIINETIYNEPIQELVSKQTLSNETFQVETMKQTLHNKPLPESIIKQTLPDESRAETIKQTKMMRNESSFPDGLVSRSFQHAVIERVPDNQLSPTTNLLLDESILESKMETLAYDVPISETEVNPTKSETMEQIDNEPKINEKISFDEAVKESSSKITSCNKLLQDVPETSNVPRHIMSTDDNQLNIMQINQECVKEANISDDISIEEPTSLHPLYAEVVTCHKEYDKDDITGKFMIFEDKTFLQEKIVETESCFTLIDEMHTENHNQILVLDKLFTVPLSDNMFHDDKSVSELSLENEEECKRKSIQDSLKGLFKDLPHQQRLSTYDPPFSTGNKNAYGSPQKLMENNISVEEVEKHKGQRANCLRKSEIDAQEIYEKQQDLLAQSSQPFLYDSDDKEVTLYAKEMSHKPMNVNESNTNENCNNLEGCNGTADIESSLISSSNNSNIQIDTEEASGVFALKHSSPIETVVQRDTHFNDTELPSLSGDDSSLDSIDQTDGANIPKIKKDKKSIEKYDELSVFANDNPFNEAESDWSFPMKIGEGSTDERSDVEESRKSIKDGDLSTFKEDDNFNNPESSFLSGDVALSPPRSAETLDLIGQTNRADLPESRTDGKSIVDDNLSILEGDSHFLDVESPSLGGDDLPSPLRSAEALDPMDQGAGSDPIKSRNNKDKHIFQEQYGDNHFNDCSLPLRLNLIDKTDGANMAKSKRNKSIEDDNQLSLLFRNIETSKTTLEFQDNLFNLKQHQVSDMETQSKSYHQESFDNENCENRFEKRHPIDTEETVRAGNPFRDLILEKIPKFKNPFLNEFESSTIITMDAETQTNFSKDTVYNLNNDCNKTEHDTWLLGYTTSKKEEALSPEKWNASTDINKNGLSLISQSTQTNTEVNDLINDHLHTNNKNSHKAENEREHRVHTMSLDLKELTTSFTGLLTLAQNRSSLIENSKNKTSFIILNHYSNELCNRAVSLALTEVDVYFTLKNNFENELDDNYSDNSDSSTNLGESNYSDSWKPTDNSKLKHFDSFDIDNLNTSNNTEEWIEYVDNLEDATTPTKNQYFISQKEIAKTTRNDSGFVSANTLDDESDDDRLTETFRIEQKDFTELVSKHKPLVRSSEETLNENDQHSDSSIMSQSYLENQDTLSLCSDEVDACCKEVSALFSSQNEDFYIDNITASKKQGNVFSKEEEDLTAKHGTVLSATDKTVKCSADNLRSVNEHSDITSNDTTDKLLNAAQNYLKEYCSNERIPISNQLSNDSTIISKQDENKQVETNNCETSDHSVNKQEGSTFSLISNAQIFTFDEVTDELMDIPIDTFPKEEGKCDSPYDFKDFELPIDDCLSETLKGPSRNCHELKDDFDRIFGAQNTKDTNQQRSFSSDWVSFEESTSDRKIDSIATSKHMHNKLKSSDVNASIAEESTTDNKIDFIATNKHMENEQKSSNLDASFGDCFGEQEMFRNVSSNKEFDNGGSVSCIFCQTDTYCTHNPGTVEQQSIHQGKKETDDFSKDPFLVDTSRPKGVLETPLGQLVPNRSISCNDGIKLKEDILTAKDRIHAAEDFYLERHISCKFCHSKHKSGAEDKCGIEINGMLYFDKENVRIDQLSDEEELFQVKQHDEDCHNCVQDLETQNMEREEVEDDEKQTQCKLKRMPSDILNRHISCRFCRARSKRRGSNTFLTKNHYFPIPVQSSSNVDTDCCTDQLDNIKDSCESKATESGEQGDHMLSIANSDILSKEFTEEEARTLNAEEVCSEPAMHDYLKESVVKSIDQKGGNVNFDIASSLVNASDCIFTESDIDHEKDMMIYDDQTDFQASTDSFNGLKTKHQISIEPLYKPIEKDIDIIEMENEQISGDEISHYKDMIDIFEAEDDGVMSDDEIFSIMKSPFDSFEDITSELMIKEQIPGRLYDNDIKYSNSVLLENDLSEAEPFESNRIELFIQNQQHECSINNNSKCNESVDEADCFTMDYVFDENINSNETSLYKGHWLDEIDTSSICIEDDVHPCSPEDGEDGVVCYVDNNDGDSIKEAFIFHQMNSFTDQPIVESVLDNFYDDCRLIGNQLDISNTDDEIKIKPDDQRYDPNEIHGKLYDMEESIKDTNNHEKAYVTSYDDSRSTALKTDDDYTNFNEHDNNSIHLKNTFLMDTGHPKGVFETPVGFPVAAESNTLNINKSPVNDDSTSEEMEKLKNYQEYETYMIKKIEKQKSFELDGDSIGLTDDNEKMHQLLSDDSNECLSNKEVNQSDELSNQATNIPNVNIQDHEVLPTKENQSEELFNQATNISNANMHDQVAWSAKQNQSNELFNQTMDALNDGILDQEAWPAKQHSLDNNDDSTNYNNDIHRIHQKDFREVDDETNSTFTIDNVSKISTNDNVDIKLRRNIEETVDVLQENNYYQNTKCDVPYEFNSYFTASTEKGISQDIDVKNQLNEDFDNVIIIDNGSSTIKAGLQTYTQPLTIPTLIGTANYKKVLPSDADQEFWIGDEANQYRGMLKLKTPIQRGIIQDWDAMEMGPENETPHKIKAMKEDFFKLWDRLFNVHLQLTPEDYPILQTEPANNTKFNRERLLEIMFETYNTPAYYTCIQGVLALYESGRTTGVVLDSGHGHTSVLPIYEGYGLPHASKTLNLGGLDVTTYLQKVLIENGTRLKTSAEFEIVSEIKEKKCLVSVDKNEGLENRKTSGSDATYELPDGQVITLDWDTITSCSEILFQPHLIGLEQSGIHEMLYTSIQATDIDLRSELLRNIVVSGGSTSLPNFDNRLENELRQLHPIKKTNAIKLSAGKERMFSSWNGASILTSLSSFQSMLISKDEFYEYGKNIVHMKCL